MRWEDARTHYPSQWLIIEAIQAETVEGHRICVETAVLEACEDGATALRLQSELSRQYPTRELYFAYSGNEELRIEEGLAKRIRFGRKSEAAMVP